MGSSPITSSPPPKAGYVFQGRPSQTLHSFTKLDGPRGGHERHAGSRSTQRWHRGHSSPSPLRLLSWDNAAPELLGVSSLAAGRSSSAVVESKAGRPDGKLFRFFTLLRVRFSASRTPVLLFHSEREKR